MRYQLKVIARLTSCAYAPPSKPGDVIWVTAEQARELVAAGVCEYAAEEFDRLYPNTPDPEAPSGYACPLRRADGWPVNRFSAVAPAWVGATVVCVGGGPSLTAQQLALVRAARVPCIVANDAYRLAPFADVHYFADYHWWQWHCEKEEFKSFRGTRCTIFGYGAMIPDASIHMLRISNQREGLSTDPGSLVTGLNSGYQMVNIATLAGAKRILIIGYDMRFQGAKTHWHEGHPIKTPEQNYSGVYAKRFHTMNPQLVQLGVEVINCTPDSALNAFPRGDLESILSDT